MKYLIRSMLVLFILPLLSSSCLANLLMISQEKKIQISADLAKTWSTYDIGMSVEHIDFYDIHYNQHTNLLYVVGYDHQHETVVAFHSTNGKTFTRETISIPGMHLSSGDEIEFMKIRPSLFLINVFGRIRRDTYFPTYFGDYAKKRKKLNFFMVRDRPDIVNPSTDTTWKDYMSTMIQNRSPFNNFSTVLDIFVSPTYKTNALHFITDYSATIIDYTPSCSPHNPSNSSYPFYTSTGSTSYIFQCGSGLNTRNPPEGALYTSPVLMNSPIINPLTHQNPSNEHLVLFGGLPNAIFAKDIDETSETILENRNYSALGTMLFTPKNDSDKQQVFFALQKGNSTLGNPSAAIAYGKDITSLTVAQIIDDSLEVPYLNRQVGAWVLQHTGSFFRFVQDRQRYIFFLTTTTPDPDHNHISLVLQSDHLDSWTTVSHDIPELPQTIREIISIPNTFHK